MKAFSLIASLLIIGLYIWRKHSMSHMLCLPDQERQVSRWAQNFSIELINRSLSFLMMQLSIVYLNQYLFTANVTFGIKSVLWTLTAVFVLDFIFYWRHRFYHRYLMIVHQLHHPRDEFELTLSLRIHPVETMIQIIIFLFVFYFFKLDVWQATVINFIFTVQAFYSHLELPLFSKRIQRLLSHLLVVPTFHEQHHAANMNFHYGFLFNIWDKIFSTAILQKEKHDQLDF